MSADNRLDIFESDHYPNAVRFTKPFSLIEFPHATL